MSTVKLYEPCQACASKPRSFRKCVICRGRRFTDIGFTEEEVTKYFHAYAITVARELGRTQYRNGDSREANPYERKTDTWRAWDDAYDAEDLVEHARQFRQELYELKGLLAECYCTEREKWITARLNVALAHVITRRTPDPKTLKEEDR